MTCSLLPLQESSTKGGVVLNGPLPGGGGEEGGASAEGTEEEASGELFIACVQYRMV